MTLVRNAEPEAVLQVRACRVVGGKVSMYDASLHSVHSVSRATGCARLTHTSPPKANMGFCFIPFETPMRPKAFT